MVTLYVLFNASCELCVRCAKWLGTQRSFVPLWVVSSQGAFARGTFPELMLGAKPEEFVLIDDAGNVYRDTEAWLLLLWSLREYRAWSLRLATPSLRPLARTLFHALSQGRGWLSPILSKGDASLKRRLELLASDLPSPCDGACGVPGADVTQPYCLQCKQPLLPEYDLCPSRVAHVLEQRE